MAVANGSVLKLSMPTAPEYAPGVEGEVSLRLLTGGGSLTVSRACMRIGRYVSRVVPGCVR